MPVICLNMWQDAAGPPPLPAFTDVAACWGLFNFNPVGYDVGNAVEIEGDIGSTAVPFTGTAPYPYDSVLVPDAGNPPYATTVWYDQNANSANLEAAGGARPSLDATNQLIDFNGTSNGLRSVDGIGGSPSGTIYIAFKAGSLVETSVILETGTGDPATEQWISIRMVAGVFTASVYDNTPVVNLANTKIKTIADSNWHLAAFSWDTSQVTPANQTTLRMDNSTSGVTSPISTDVLSLAMGGSRTNIGARNNAASLFFTGSMRDVYYKNVVDDATAQTAFFDYWTYLQSVSP